jgi:MFS family permease
MLRKARIAVVLRRPKLSGLWRHPDFLKLWAGATISMLGSQVTYVALPLIAASTLGATPAQMAMLRTVEFLPAALVGLFAGVWADRLRRRPILIGTDLGSAALLLSLPAALALGMLRMPLVYAVAFMVAALGVFSARASGPYLSSLVGREQLIEAYAKLAVSGSVTRIAGPGIAGLLVQLLTAPAALAADAFSFLVSALFLGRIRAQEVLPPRPQRPRGVWSEISEGMRTLARSAYLRAFLLSSVTLDLFWNALFAVYVLYVTRDLGLPAGALGLIFSIGSAGSLLGSLVASRVAGRFGVGRTVVVAQASMGLGGLLIALSVALRPSALALLVASELVMSFAGTIYGINRGGVQLAVTPVRLRGRVDASISFIGLGVVPADALLGGFSAERVGVPAVIALCGCGEVLAFLWLLFSPVRELQGMPAPEEPGQDRA